MIFNLRFLGGADSCLKNIFYDLSSRLGDFFYKCHQCCVKIKFKLGISQIFEFSTIVHKLFLNLYLSLPFLINLRVKENLREQGLLHF